MIDWRNLFQRKQVRTIVGSTQMASGNLHAEYHELVAKHLRQLGIPPNSFELDVGSRALQGRTAYNVKIRLVRWDRSASLRLLVSLPLLEAKVRKAVAANWLGEVSQFGGLWLHSSSTLAAEEVAQDSEWAISELQLFDSAGAVAADRLKREMGQSARAARSR